LLAGYTVALGVTYGGFLLFRYLYFGYWLPNTYYAKGGPSSKILVPALTLQHPFLQKFQQLMASMFGTKLWLAMPFAVVVVLTLALARRSGWRKYVMLIGFGFIGYYSYMIMPDDWMPEYRFAIPVFVFVSALIAVLGAFIVQSIRTPRAGIRKGAGIFLAALFLGLTLKVQVPRLQKFYRAPIVSFDHIANEFAFRFNRYAEELGLDSASVLLPDVGATLYYSNLRVYDLARLTDVTIARTLRKNQPAFYDYVFETIKPTFIHIHGNWTYAADFDADSRFRRDYTPINEYKDAWALRVVKREMMSGNYVRRDAVVGKEDILAALTAAK
jgi:hypothetical protein